MLNRFFSHELKPIALDKFAAINAEAPAAKVSSRYSFIPTTRALTVLQDYGWQPVQAIEARTRSAELAGFQKHAIRLANTRLNTELAVGSTIPQLMLTNSHAGTAAFELSLALFEKVCANGLCVQRGNGDQLKVRHQGYADAFMEEALRQLLPSVEPTLQLTDQFKGLKLDNAERQAFAEAAIELRWNGEEFAVDAPRLLMPQRSAERDPNLWNTYNVVQEHIIRGGVPQRDVRNGSKTFGKQTRARAVNSLDENLRLNRALWKLTEAMHALKAN